MIRTSRQLSMSYYSDLYDILVDKSRFLPRFHDEVDFSFIFVELVSKYCPDNGRPPCDPVFMFKCLIIKCLSNLSDVDLMDEIKVNLEYKYFLDMNPEDLPPDSSTLCVFRRQRLKDEDMMMLLLGKTFELAKEKGIIKRKENDNKYHINVIIDGTHTDSLHGICRPVPTLKELSKRLRHEMYKANAELSGNIEKDHAIDNKALNDEVEYCKRLLAYVEECLPELLLVKRASRIFNRLKELIEDILEHYAVNPSDPDARVGHKSADTEFFGYKSQIAIDEESRLILDAEVTSGEVGDALPGLEVLQRITNQEGVKIDEVLGDTAYSGQPFLELASNEKFSLIAPPHPILGKGIDGRDGFTFNKDADMFCCPKGHLAISKRIVVHKKDNYRKSLVYSFDSKICSVCPLRSTCIKGKAKHRTFSVSLLTPEQKKLLEEQKTDYFKTRRRQRYKIEAKNAHLKQSYSMRKTQGKGIQMMTLQAAIAFFTSNMKIILTEKGKN